MSLYCLYMFMFMYVDIFYIVCLNSLAFNSLVVSKEILQSNFKTAWK